LVVAKYSHSVNYYTSINLTKLDILDGLRELKIAIAYKLDGVELDSFPADLSILEKVEPVYLIMPGWPGKSAANATSYYALPKAARDYIDYIEEFLGVPVEYVGVGPSRDNMLKRGKAAIASK